MKFSNAKLRRYYESKLRNLERARVDVAHKLDRAYMQTDISHALALEERYAKIVGNIALVRSLLSRYQVQPTPA